jgi:hypothetical protein
MLYLVDGDLRSKGRTRRECACRFGVDFGVLKRSQKKGRKSGPMRIITESDYERNILRGVFLSFLEGIVFGNGQVFVHARKEMTVVMIPRVETRLKPVKPRLNGVT